MDAAIPADAQNAPTGIWKSRTEREIPTAPTPIIVVVNERKNNGDSNSVAKPSTESDQAHTQRRGHDGPVKQGEQEVLHARDSVGQTSGATQRCLNPGFSERIGNSRRTGDVQKKFGQEVLGLYYVVSNLSIAQATAEIIPFYADDVELRAAATQLWNEMSETNLIGKATWNIRTKALLGVIG